MKPQYTPSFAHRHAVSQNGAIQFLDLVHRAISSTHHHAIPKPRMKK